MPIPRPFHESIVGAIRGARHKEDLQCLFGIIQSTTIPANHDEIQRAIDDTSALLGFPARNELVAASLLEQKRGAQQTT